MEWIFSGIEWLISLFTKKQEPSQTQTNNNNQSQNVIFNIAPPNTLKEESIQNFASLKDTIHILFIDDEKFEMVNILKKMGWKNIKYKKDITNIDCDDVHWSNVIFVDVNGVGSKLFKDQGIGLGAAIKDKYKDKKVVIYSAESKGDRLDPDLRKIDATLLKNAEPIQFSNLIEEFWDE